MLNMAVEDYANICKKITLARKRIDSLDSDTSMLHQNNLLTQTLQSSRLAKNISLTKISAANMYDYIWNNGLLQIHLDNWVWYS